ncbi:MAG TPA: FAD-binding protein, partial [Turneriella sp.]|nr:FAD-binding protein [Turneriella sp.]
MEKRSLKTLNTFGIDVLANCIEFFQSEEELTTLLQQENIRKQFMILGGGSNILFCHDFDGAILKNEIKTLNFTDKGAITTATVGGGFTWHSFVETCVQKSLYGVENLALIPGTVGASPIQNI